MLLYCPECQTGTITAGLENWDDQLTLIGELMFGSNLILNAKKWRMASSVLDVYLYDGLNYYRLDLYSYMLCYVTVSWLTVCRKTPVIVRFNLHNFPRFHSLALSDCIETRFVSPIRVIRIPKTKRRNIFTNKLSPRRKWSSSWKTIRKGMRYRSISLCPVRS